MHNIYKLLKEIKSRTGSFCIDVSLSENYSVELDTDIDPESLSMEELENIVGNVDDLLTLTIYHEEILEPVVIEININRIDDFDLESMLLEMEIQLDKTNLYYHNVSQMVH